MSTLHINASDAWDEDELIGKRAADWYNRHREIIDTKENRYRYVLVDSETGDFEFGDDESDVEKRFEAKFGSGRKAVMFHIGRI